MRIIPALEMTPVIKKLFIEANIFLPCDVKTKIEKAAAKEKDRPCEILKALLTNAEAAEKNTIAICQDTGMAVVFVDIGREVYIEGNLEEAVNAGISAACKEGYLRASILSDPLRRQNTGDNTPAVIHTRFVDGDALTITVAPKGFGSENMSKIKMMLPSATKEDIVDFVVSVMRDAGANPCPPVVIGVGIGGNFETCALLSKRALCRSLDTPNSDELYAGLERDMLSAINALDIGPQGFGGITTALGVNIEYAPTHIAGLPVAVNMGCHVNRHKTAVI